MSTGMPELGSKISLISKADIRYEGRLFTVDPQECTIALSSVRSFGTEDRETQCPIPAQNQVYDYILFRGSDIKDIRVLNNVPAQTLNDPAIMQLSVPPTLGHPQQFGAHPVVGHVPVPAAMGGSYGGAFGSIGMGAAGMPSGLAPGMGVPGRVGGAKPNVFLDMIGGASRSTTPVSLHSHKSSGVDQSVQAGGGVANAKKDDKTGGSRQNQQQQRVGGDPRRRRSRSRERKDSRGTSGVGGGDGQEVQSRPQNRAPGGQRNQQNYNYSGYQSRSGDYQSRGGDYQSRGGDYQSRGGDYQHRGGDYQQRGGDYQHRGGDYQQRGGDYQQRGGDYQQRGGDYQQRGGDYQQRGGDQNAVGNQNSRGGWAQQRGPPRTRGLRPRGSQGGYRPMNLNQSGGPPNQNQMAGKKRNTLKFDNDYDFEQANTEFEELRSQLSKVKIDDTASTGTAKSEGGVPSVDPATAPVDANTTTTSAIITATTTVTLNGESEKKDDSGNETGAGETEQEEEQEVFYDKKKSFFDKISCEAVERAKGKSQRTDWRQERKLNSETFGVAAMRRGNFRGRGGGYRGMGYRGGFRPGYRPQQQRRDQTSNNTTITTTTTQSQGKFSYPILHYKQPGAGRELQARPDRVNNNKSDKKTDDNSSSALDATSADQEPEAIDLTELIEKIEACPELGGDGGTATVVDDKTTPAEVQVSK